MLLAPAQAGVFPLEMDMIKIDFEFDSPHGVFRDAIHLAEDHTFTDDEIQAMKQQRYDNWWAIVTNPPAEE